MRTTLNIDDRLLIAAKHQALEQRISLVKVIENALRASMAKTVDDQPKVRLVTTGGSGVKPGVDLDSHKALLDIMGDGA